MYEFDPIAGREVWRYAGDPERSETRFYSRTASTVARLPNGNTLIVVTEAGQAIEVTPGGEVVCEFFNPARTGEKSELIASLLQLQRVPPEFVSWLSEKPAE